MVISASGQIGSALMREGARRQWDMVGTARDHPEFVERPVRLDLEDPAAIDAVIREVRPEAVCLVSGMGNADLAEEDPRRAWKLNSEAAEATARTAAAVCARFSYVSSAFVFDGSSERYYENSAVRPLSVYGQSKVDGERRVQQAHPNALILRTVVVYGPDPQRRNFATQVVDRLSRGEAMQVPVDQIANPIYNRDFARIAMELMERDSSGIWNVAGTDEIDRYSFGVRIARRFGLEESQLKATLTSKMGYRAPRPLSACLSIEKLHTAGIEIPGSLDRGIEDFFASERERKGENGQ